jgi:predicted phosphodiesterase
VTKKSKYDGVYWDSTKNKWTAQICISGKKYNLGRFDNEDDAGMTNMEAMKSKKTDLDSAIQIVQNGGFFVSKKPLQRGYTFDLDMDHHHGNVFKIGLVSYTHMCSKYQQLNVLWQFYKYCEEEGIRDVMMAGDISDGYNMYPGHLFEVAVHGERAQANYIIENYPKFDDIKTTFIGGNHDESFWKKDGSDICYDVANERNDLIYKGYYLANFDLNGINICLHHGDGGVAYAKSYRPQKLALSKIEDEGIKNPDVLIIGHYHSMCLLPKYIGMYVIQMPCFQGQTPAYMGKKGLSPDIGGIILEIEEKNGKILSTKTQYVGYQAKADDY